MSKAKTMMKIVVLMGSPNRNGSTGILVQNFQKGAEEAGHSVDVIDICHAACFRYGRICHSSLLLRHERPAEDSGGSLLCIQQQLE